MFTQSFLSCIKLLYFLLNDTSELTKKATVLGTIFCILELAKVFALRMELFSYRQVKYGSKCTNNLAY